MSRQLEGSEALLMIGPLLTSASRCLTISLSRPSCPSIMANISTARELLPTLSSLTGVNTSVVSAHACVPAVSAGDFTSGVVASLFLSSFSSSSTLKLSCLALLHFSERATSDLAVTSLTRECSLAISAAWSSTF